MLTIIRQWSSHQRLEDYGTEAAAAAAVLGILQEAKFLLLCASLSQPHLSTSESPFSSARPGQARPEHSLWLAPSPERTTGLLLALTLAPASCGV